jgi:hypothetical protein
MDFSIREEDQMEYLAPSFELLLSVRQSIQSGRSVRSALFHFLEGRDLKCPLAQQVQQLVFSFDAGGEFENLDPNLPILRKALYQTLWQGLMGVSISERLDQLAQEFQSHCRDHIDQYTATLPMKVMVPLLLMLFPAYMLLMIGPILQELLRSLDS